MKDRAKGSPYFWLKREMENLQVNSDLAVCGAGVALKDSLCFFLSNSVFGEMMLNASTAMITVLTTVKSSNATSQGFSPETQLLNVY